MPRDRREPFVALGPDLWDRSEQTLRIGMARPPQGQVLRPLFENPAGIEHAHPSANPVHHAEIMGDEEHGELGAVA